VVDSGGAAVGWPGTSWVAATADEGHECPISPTRYALAFEKSDLGRIQTESWSELSSDGFQSEAPAMSDYRIDACAAIVQDETLNDTCVSAQIPPYPPDTSVPARHAVPVKA
jgi:hypothetical protein